MSWGEGLWPSPRAGQPVSQPVVPKPSPAPVSALVPRVQEVFSDPKADCAAVEALIDEIRNAARLAGMTRDDPMMPLLTALTGTIRFQHERNARSEQISKQYVQRTVEMLQLNRANNNTEIVRLEAEAARIQANVIKDLGARIVADSNEAFTQRARTFERNSILFWASVLVAIIMCAVGSGFQWGHQNAMTGIHETEAGLQAAFANGPADARMWLELMQWNNLRSALVQCNNGNRSSTDSRLECDMPFWIEAPHAALPTPPIPEVVFPTPSPATQLPPAEPSLRPKKTSGWHLPRGLRPTGPVEFH